MAFAVVRLRAGLVRGSVNSLRSWIDYEMVSEEKEEVKMTSSMVFVCFFSLQQLGKCSTFCQEEKDQKRNNFRTSTNQEFSLDTMKLEDFTRYHSKISGRLLGSSRKLSELKAWGR